MLSACSDTRARTRFVREARAAARIDHRNVVDIYDIGQDGDRGLYMVMQLLRGESLAKRLSRGRLGIEETVELLLPAMRGVAAVHAAGVVHRDLKPDNIFLCEAPLGLRDDAKVLDFGISSMSAQEDADPTLTRDGALVGTLAYMSPEQIQNSRAVDARTDVYAFGVILYEALTGRKPFRADTHNALVLAIIAGNPRDPREHRVDLPEGLAKVVLRALCNNCEDRFPDVQSLIDALTAHEVHDVSSKRTRFAGGRASGLVAAAMASVLTLAFGAWWWLSAQAISFEKVAAKDGISTDTVLRPLAPLPGRRAAPTQTSNSPAFQPAASTVLSARTFTAPDASQRALGRASDEATLSPTSSRSGPRSGLPRSGLRRTKSAARSVAPKAIVKPLPGAAGATGVAARSGRIVFEEL
jgi:serine/threonine protein kinase